MMSGGRPKIPVEEDTTGTETDTGADTESEMAEAYEKALQSTGRSETGMHHTGRGRHLTPLKIDRPEHQFIQPRKIFAQRTDQGIISLPEGAGDSMQHESGGSGNVPMHVRGSLRSHKTVGEPIDIVIYFMDKTGLTLPVLDGQHAQAGELFEMVMQELELPHEAREVFSLWMVSDLLELQLKPNHVPFKLTCQWDELLEKYTTAEQEDIERDEPVIMFQRNVFYSKSKENGITDARLNRFLYYEAKENIVDGRYPVDDNVANKLAGMHAVVKNGQFQPARHTPAFYKPNIEEYYPSQLCKRGFSLFRSKSKPEHIISQYHELCSKNYQPISPETVQSIMMEYLRICREMPHYASAYFNGQIEKPSRFNLTSHPDDPVYVAINTEGVNVIDMDKVETLLSLDYSEVSWEYGEPEDKEDSDKLPCLFLQFNDTEANNKVCRVLQIFSKEAIMMDALIEACVGLQATKSAQHLSRSGRGSTPTNSHPSGQKKMDRLCMATFNRTGESVKSKSVRAPSTKGKK